MFIGIATSHVDVLFYKYRISRNFCKDLIFTNFAKNENINQKKKWK